MPLEKIFCEWESHARMAGVLSQAHPSPPLIRHVEGQLPQGIYIFLITGSFGDVIPNFFLVEKYAEEINEKVVILTYSSMSAFVRRLDPERCDCRFVDDDVVPHLHRALFVEGRVFYKERGRIFPTLLTLHPYIAEACISGRMLDYEAKRLLLSLPHGCEIPFRYDERILEFHMEKIKLCSLGGQKVVISPFSNTNQSFSPLFLEKLVELLSESFQIVINMGGANETRCQPYKKALEKFKAILIINASPHEVFEIVKIVGVHIGALNGLSGMLTMFDSNSRHVIIREDELVNPSTNRPVRLSSFRELIGHDWNRKSKVLELVVRQNYLSGELNLSPLQEEIEAFLQLDNEIKYLVKTIA